MSTGQAWWHDKEEEFKKYHNLCSVHKVKAKTEYVTELEKWEDHFKELLNQYETIRDNMDESITGKDLLDFLVKLSSDQLSLPIYFNGGWSECLC